MSLETDLVAVLQGVCPRVYPGTTQANVQRPFLTYEHIGGDPLRYVDNTAAPQRMAWLQVNTWASTKAEALSLSLAVEQALCSAAAFTAAAVGALRGTTQDEVEPVLYGSLQDFQVLGTR